MFAAILHGLILSFGLILPLGVQNIFVFNQGAVQTKFLKAMPVVVTASICDTFLITLAVLGVSVVVLGIYWIKAVLLLVGIMFLLYMGYVTWRSKPNTSVAEEKALAPKKQIAFAVSVSLLNPHAIMDTIGVIGTNSLSYSGIGKLGFTFACIATSWIWFFFLAFVGSQVGRFNHSGRFMILLNRVSATIMWGTAIYLLHTLLIT